MKVKDVMAREVLTLGANESITTAAQRMKATNVDCLVITGSGVQGIITDRDVAIRCIAEEHDACDCKVSTHMSTPVITADPDMDLLDAAHLMTKRQVKRLPVMEGQKLVGMVSLSDIAIAMDSPWVLPGERRPRLSVCAARGAVNSLR